MLSDLQTKAAQAIVNIFETSRIHGDYAKVTLLADDTGGLTYGKAQTTLGSGGLHRLVEMYCAAPGARDAAELRGYLPRLAARDRTLDSDGVLRAALRDAASDQVMRETQDRFFDAAYWQPALESADYIGATTALGCSIIYDGRVHGSWHALRDSTIEEHGSLEALGEAVWFGHYVARRRHWLATHGNTGLRPTVYRMDSYRELMETGNWALTPPFSVRGQRITEAALIGAPADIQERPLLKRRNPMMQGPDVERLQRALKGQDIAIEIDGIFGGDTEAAVRLFQDRMGLVVDGIVGEGTWAALGLQQPGT